MNRNLESIAVFFKVAEQSSFTLAARDLRISPSLASKHVFRLENDLGVTLFTRSKRQIHLTKYGEELYRLCARPLIELNDAQATLRGKNFGVQGTLRLHVTQGIGRRLVEPALAHFMKEHPDLSVELSVTAEIVNPLNHGLDIAIRSGARDDAHMMHSSLGFRELGKVRYVICASQSYLRAHGTPQEPSDLVNHNCLIHFREGLPRAWRFQGPDGEYTVPVSGTLVSNSHNMVYEAAVEGLGIARFLAFESKNLGETAGLTTLFFGATVSDRIVRAFFPRDGGIPKNVSAFLDFLAERTVAV